MKLVEVTPLLCSGCCNVKAWLLLLAVGLASILNSILPPVTVEDTLVEIQSTVLGLGTMLLELNAVELFVIVKILVVLDAPAGALYVASLFQAIAGAKVVVVPVPLAWHVIVAPEFEYPAGAITSTS